MPQDGESYRSPNFVLQDKVIIHQALHHILNGLTDHSLFRTHFLQLLKLKVLNGSSIRY
jgi:hypothetical protein